MSRFFAKIIVEGMAAMSNAVYTAYHLALRNARGGGGGGGAVKGAVRRGNKMHYDEALKILNIEKPDLNRKILEEQYKHLFDGNNPERGGSFYLQSKIFRAKEAVDREMMMERKARHTSSSSSSSSSNNNHDAN